jgi:predicted transcriptional regulator
MTENTTPKITTTQTPDTICQTIANAIEQNGKLSLNQIIQKTGHARQTITNHLKHLLNYGIIRKEIKTNNRGRPTKLYYRTPKALADFDKTEIVIIPFKRLKVICRLQNQNYCKNTKDLCTFEKCPIMANKLPK